MNNQDTRRDRNGYNGHAMNKVKILVIGKSGRLDALLTGLFESSRSKELYVLSEVTNPGLTAKSEQVFTGITDDLADVEICVQEVAPDFVVIGPEEPLAAGVVDKLQEMGIPCVGPTQALAKLESSKSFTRELLTKYKIPGNPEYRVFRTLEGIRDYLQVVGSFVVKPDGLTGGKGVKVFGEHLHSVAEAVAYCAELFEDGQSAVVIEEKLDGEEFSFQSFYDGKHIVHTIPVQDHKRAHEGDTGPNTGGMGSYSCADHSLPFLSPEHVQEAAEINRLVGEALLKEVGQEYKGVLYGGFMLTKSGLRVIEYNARFGDPEIMNVLPLMQADLIDVCEAIIAGTLDELSVQFKRQATVCKYVVPDGYPDMPDKRSEIQIDATGKMAERNENLRMYYAAVRQEDDRLCLTGSRALALVGSGETLLEAERIAEKAAESVAGPVFHRRDIGTPQLIQKRLDHMQQIIGERNTSPSPSTHAERRIHSPEYGLSVGTE